MFQTPHKNGLAKETGPLLPAIKNWELNVYPYAVLILVLNALPSAVPNAQSSPNKGLSLREIDFGNTKAGT